MRVPATHVVTYDSKRKTYSGWQAARKLIINRFCTSPRTAYVARE
jgi:hypothetical protein